MSEHDERTPAEGPAEPARGRVTRRGVLGGGATVSVAGAALGAAADQAADGEVAPQDDPKRLTYRETDHIRAFYRRSRV